MELQLHFVVKINMVLWSEKHYTKKWDDIPALSGSELTESKTWDSVCLTESTKEMGLEWLNEWMNPVFEG